MTLAVTLMVRDEADVIPAWLDHHVAQGFDVFVITDNGSVDGTTDLLTAFAARTDVTVDLRHDPVHRKQQGTVVTGMARDAARSHHADWVVNADADEFILPVDRSLTVGEVFERLDPVVGAFTVPVVNMTGMLAESGGGIERLHWRDDRSVTELQAIGLIGPPSTNAVHVGDPDVTVVQGNHQVSVANGAPVPAGLELEVLHLPWRSWTQYEHRVDVSGRAYEANPDLTPSPRHHGMRDLRRLREGVLESTFALRFVTDDEAAAGPFTRDDGIAEVLRRAGSTSLDGTPDPVVPEDRLRRLQQVGHAIVTRDRRIESLEDSVRAGEATADTLRATVQFERDRAQAALREVRARDAELAAMRARRVVRIADRAGDVARRLRRG
ncbi:MULTISPECIES: glycosyltransferase family 2 protein [unclassified Curtobacterium]|uniref:glycosyltransferase family 2 protein n=1 Tax=unclassified Curtobacterium TaxID=257496 RepID=UPI000D93ADD2|nr:MULTISPECIES: glycosyltransferase family 2 protein [unclassified Curtobacterium]PYY37347.1 glycosyltransferase family 2 protein [Curtobacterium sp. MCBD17_030]PZE36203.1 glycosyltransferase family 2 protein [Curtobacterium sp. MCPF17_031]PZF12587.1 glycosyltransferase family 2 protein [Curtobacterium sp. MCPF17_011]